MGIGQSLYRDERAWKQFINNCIKIYNNKTFYMEPLNQCSIKYYGNGKVVALERVDLYNRNEPGIIMNYTDNDEEMIESRQLLLYRPSKNAPLEQIRQSFKIKKLKYIFYVLKMFFFSGYHSQVKNHNKYFATK